MRRAKHWIEVRLSKLQIGEGGLLHSAYVHTFNTDICVMAVKVRALISKLT